MRDFSVLSDVEFEELVGDLLGVENNTLVERFAAGADGGVDLRWHVSGGVHIAQCKHYRKSSFSQLLDSARKEVQKVERLKPDRYYFITTFDLSISQKDRIYDLFKSWMRASGDVLGGRDVDALITKNGAVEQRHPKLWVSTGMQLFWALHSDIANRTNALRSRIERSLPRYVVSPGYQNARDILAEHNVCLISGPPGIGKTTLAQMLMAEHISMRYEPVEVSGDIGEAWAALRQDSPQIFLYDDFLGQITFAEKLPKNEDKRLSDIVERFSTGNPSKKLILTTREYILRDAKLSYERLNDLDSKYHFLLELKAYDKADRAQILYNHLWHSELSPNCLREIAQGGYKRIITHPAYNPRLVEYCTGSAFDLESPGYPERFKATLDHPERIWKIAFERHIDVEQQLLVMVLCSLPRAVRLEPLREAHFALCEALGIVSTESSFRGALDVLEGTFIAIYQDRERDTLISHLNPSVTEFALGRISADRRTVSALLESAIYFEQLSELFLYGRGNSLFRPGSAPLMAALSLKGPECLKAALRLIDSPSPKQVEVLASEASAGIFIDPADKLEGRVLFLLEIYSEWGADSTEIGAVVDLLTARWRTRIGDKGAALRLLRSLDVHSLDELSNRAHEVLHEWLESTLIDADDWSYYAEHLTGYHDIQLEDMGELAEHFERFMDRRLLEPDSPGYLSDLKSLADDFGLDELSDRIEEAMRDEYEPDDDYEPDGSRHLGDDRGSDEYIAELFGRFDD
ncbi:ATP-binding protein [Streptomyces subrutilus]|nr:ATP-binding protein [Streptomyces subrutilus]